MTHSSCESQLSPVSNWETEKETEKEEVMAKLAKFGEK